jgi:tripartite-type tricarboxylate transporter receptor subunit TctC
LCACVASAASYPNKPIRVIVAAAPGGGSDFIARLLGQHLSPVLGQTVVIDNRAGAAGNIAAELTAKAPPDGYTLIVVASSHASNINLYRKLAYDPIRDFAPITQLTANFFLLTVQPSSPATTVKDFVAWAKSKKGSLTYASAGAGQGAHLGMELLKMLAGFNAVHVPYGGIGPATVSLLAGQVDVALLTPPAAMPHVKSGKLKALAVTSPRPVALLPGIPTVAEAGFAGYEVNNWQGLMAPVGTPKEVIAKLHEEVSKALKAPDVVDRLALVATEPVASTPAEFADFLQAEITKWGKVIKQSGARAD